MNGETTRTSSDAAIHSVAEEMPIEPSDLKVRINTLLWEVLPGKTTLYKAEHIACEFFAAIAHEWD